MTVVALAGNPNSGKTTLFNRLTGLQQKVGNYPGVTVERRQGTARWGDSTHTVVDLPGTYSLISRSRDEAVAFETLTDPDGSPDLVVCVVDASNLHRNLYLVLSIVELGLRCVVALNMVDVAEEGGVKINATELSAALGVPVVPIIATSKSGLPELQAAIDNSIKAPLETAARRFKLSDEDEAAVAQVKDALLQDQAGLSDAKADAEAVWLLASLGSADADADEDPTEGLHQRAQALAKAAELAAQDGRARAARIIEARFSAVNGLLEGVIDRQAVGRSTSDRLDSVLLHPFFGTLIFFFVMALVFQSIFSWAEPMMGWIEAGVGWTQATLQALLPAGALADLLVDGVVGGVGNVIVFVPQIAILFAFIALLEDSGYLARAAFISDRFMARAGLHGRAFVPLLSGFACAIPAVMATRSIEQRRDRLVTIMVIPLVTCSARLPVFTLVIASLFAADLRVAGFLTVGGLLMLAMYVLSIVTTVAVAFVLKKTLLKSPTPPLVLELPPYRRPELLGVLLRVRQRVKVFVRDAGTVILALSIILWGLLYFPRQADLPFEPAAEIQRLQATMSPEGAAATVDAKVQSERVAQSFAGRIGHAIEPAIRPLGYDWQIGVGLLASFAAREVFVSTMGLVFGVGEEADEESSSLRDQMRTRYTPLVGLSLMIFFLFAAQCMSTIAVARRETGGWKWPIFMVVYMTALAWFAALLVYQGGKMLGFT